MTRLDPSLLRILPRHLEMVKDLLRQHLPDAEVWAYGSRVTGKGHEASDLDLVVRNPGNPQVELSGVAELKEAFTESDLPIRVDVVEWARVPESFHRNIEEKYVVVQEVDGCDSEGFRGIIERDRVVQQGGMAGEWLKTTIGEQATLQRGFDITKAEQNIGNVPVISSGGISSYHDKPAAIGPGVILGRKGVVGSVYFVASDYWPHDTTLWVKDFHGNDRRFVYFFFKWMAQRIATMDVGSANPTLNRNHVHPIEIRWPPLPEQHTIAHILGALDDKIEINRRMNADLEAMARALFKDWFVDFGPVRAKSEGRPAYLAPEIWDLFPDALDDEDKPVGWRWGTLGDVASSVGQVVDPRKMSPETPYIGLEHMPRQSIALENWEKASKVTSGKLAFRRGDFLFGKLRPYFHKVGIAAVDGICSTDIIVLRGVASPYGAFVISCISSKEFVAFADQPSEGTKMPRTSWEIMSRFPVSLPSKWIMERFQENVMPALDRILANIAETQTLAQLRDLLLPKLITGEIRVRDAEKAVEAAL